MLTWKELPDSCKMKPIVENDVKIVNIRSLSSVSVGLILVFTHQSSYSEVKN